MEYRLVNPTPELVADLWKRFYRAKHGFAYALRVDEFVALMTAQDTAIGIIGDYGGVVLLTDIVARDDQSTMIEPRASVHALYWDKSVMGKPEMATGLCLEAVRRWGLHRLIAEIPVNNSLASSYAVKVGFKPIGRLRKRLFVKGRWMHAMVYDALTEDLEAALGRQGDGRHRRVRGKVERQESVPVGHTAA